MQPKRFPEFGKELRRAFEVHENCYDCADFYDGCRGWRASKVFACGDFNRLPDVLPGTCGQRFPPPRRQAPANPAPKPIERQPAKPKARICGCGDVLPKGKRLCDTCRTENRRRTLRAYMREYRKQPAATVVRSDPNVPFPAQGTHVA